MGHLSRAISAVGGRPVIAGVGGLYVGLAAAWGLLQVGEGVPLGNVLILSVLVGGPGFVLLYGGYRLPRTDIHPELYATVASWCLGAIGVMFGVLALYDLQPADGLSNPAESALILTALASVSGLGIGIHDASAKTRTREAEQHSRELERQNDRLESFAGMLAHELRNPLTVAQIYHQQERPRDEDAAEEVDTALERIEEMIDVLLVTVRGADVSIDDEPVALADVAADAWADLSPEAATLVVETEGTIRADPVHVRHLLTNLFRNAIEHGGEAVTVRVGDLPRGFYVVDDGPGISEDAREEVAEAGFTTKSDGIGLGLTFVAQLVETYDWHWAIVESDAGGARFEFTNVEIVSTGGELQPR